MPNNPRKEMRAAKREARQDAKVEKRTERTRKAFLDYSNDNMKKYVKKHTPEQIKQMIDETPEGMRLPWMTTYKAPTTMKTGGMVNPNAKISALKKAGSKGVKSGVNPKAKATGKATGKTGGISKAPKGAAPKKNKKG
jgi:hypothetical protein